MKTFVYKSEAIASLCLVFGAVASLFPLVVAAQECLGNVNVGCTSPGAKCTGGGTAHGVCTTVPLPKGERECVCKGPAASSSPPVVLYPRYVIASLVYAPPGCTSTASAKCGQTGLVDYSSGSSMGTKLDISNSFKAGVTATVSGGVLGEGGSAGFGFSNTNGSSNSVGLTKSSSDEVKAPGPTVDGIDHDLDMFVILINPIVTVSTDSAGNVHWTPSFPATGAAPQNVWVSELRNPATMNPSKAQLLSGLGFTAADYKTIRCMDPFAGPGVRSGPGGVAVPDPCEVTVAENGNTAPALDTARFFYDGQTIQYDVPPSGGSCPNEIYQLKNEYDTTNGNSKQVDYTVTLQAQGGVPVFASLKLKATLDWTTSTTSTVSTTSTQTATYTAACPSSSYTGPTDFVLYTDALYGTFAFVPYDAATMEIIHQGTITRADKPIAGELVTLAYGGHTYRAYTSARGNYRFVHMKKPGLAATQKATLTVGGQKQSVSLKAESTSNIQLK